MRTAAIIFGLLLPSLLSGAAAAQNMDTNDRPVVDIAYISRDLDAAGLDDDAWNSAADVTVARYWSGNAAPAGRHFKARLLWSDTSFYVRFEALQSEPLVVSSTPDLKKKTMGLWDRDVCEIFLAPDPSEPNRYFEFEVAPTGEWIDVGIVVTPQKRESDWGYRSGMESAARIGDGRILMAIKINWKAFGKKPKAGDEWLGNLFRCVGKDPGRGYLAWQPTGTPAPNFHVPAKFGRFRFVK